LGIRFLDLNWEYGSGSRRGKMPPGKQYFLEISVFDEDLTLVLDLEGKCFHVSPEVINEGINSN